MKAQILYQLLWLFFLYSFLGWITETSVVIIKTKKFLNRGILNGPLSIIYGISAVGITVGFKELENSLVFLFIGTMCFSTFVQWITGYILEKEKKCRWWNYSNKKFNLDGYICLQYSVLWGVLGIIGLKYINPIFLKLYNIVPSNILRIVLWILLILTVVDITGSYIAISNRKKIVQVEEIRTRIGSVTIRFGNWILKHINKRMEKAHPNAIVKIVETVKEDVFAQGCGFYKLTILFFIGAFIGDIIETLYCRTTAGYWMSRSSVVWGPFSIVWGLAMVLATLLLHEHRKRSDSFIFLFGTALGGVYEYLCSVFTEIVFGKVFWDYSKIPFNLGGRINLLYCFFWGFAAVIWIKVVYPFISDKIELIPIKAGKICTWILIVFMVCNICVSAMAMTRYTERERGVPAVNSTEEWMDEHYNDETMEKIYPNAKSTVK